MNELLSHWGDVQAIEGYRCELLLGARGQTHPVIGYALLAVGIPTLILYVICLCSMMTKTMRQTTCYRIMIYLGIVDIGAILINSIETGFFSLEGAVYCTYPTLIYISGAVGLALWCSSCLTCFMLVLNRLIYLSSATGTQPQADPWWHSVLCLSAATVYTLYFFLFTRPLLYSSDRAAWFFSPFTAEYSYVEYGNHSHSVNNLLIVAATACAYFYFVILLRRKYKRHEQPFSFKNNPIIVQAVMMCFFNMFAALVYVYMQYFPVWPSLILIGHFCWIFGHGCSPYLYLTLNTSMRRRVLTFLGITYWQRARTILPGREIELDVRQFRKLNLPKLLMVKKNANNM